MHDEFGGSNTSSDNELLLLKLKQTGLESQITLKPIFACCTLAAA